MDNFSRRNHLLGVTNCSAKIEQCQDTGLEKELVQKRRWIKCLPDTIEETADPRTHKWRKMNDSSYAALLDIFFGFCLHGVQDQSQRLMTN